MFKCTKMLRQMNINVNGQSCTPATVDSKCCTHKWLSIYYHTL